jgi:hypothetical protein
VGQKAHSNKTKMIRCTNSETIAHRLESCVLSLVREIMTDSGKLKKYLVGLNNRTSKSTAKLKLEQQLKNLDQKLFELTKLEKTFLDDYALGKISRDEYAFQSRNCDLEISKIKIKRSKLVKQIPALHDDDVVEVSIKHFCDLVKTETEEATDFYSQREFLKKYINQVIFTNGDVELIGFIPVQLKTYDDPNQSSELNKIEFRIPGKVKMGMKNK